MAGVKDRVPSENRLFEKIAEKIPGYRGYKSKENRRQSDRLLRQKLTRELGEVKNDLSIIQDSFVDDLELELGEDAENLVKTVGAQSVEIDQADGGYSKIFNTAGIQEDELERIYEFDSSLLDSIEDIKKKTEELCELVDEGETKDLWRVMEGLREKLNELRDVFEKRTDAMEGIK